MTVSANGKVALVSGATNGIGLVTARELARQGYSVAGVARSAERARALQAQWRREMPGASVTFFQADLSDMAQVRGLAAAFLQRFDRLHLLVNNAGAYFMQRQRSVDGYELTFALNHLSYFLLTNLLLEVLKTSAPARIVNVASEASQGGKIDLDDLPNPRSYESGGFQAYSNSKLCNIAFTYELARRLQGSGVTANALHPGFVASGFARNNMRGLLAPAGWVYGLAARLVARSPEKGAETSLYLATSPEVAEVSGQYFSDCRPIRSAAQSYDEGLQRGLWELSERLTGGG